VSNLATAASYEFLMTRMQTITRRTRDELVTHGWALLTGPQREGATAGVHCLALARQLGTPTPTRGRRLLDVLVPQVSSQASPRSLSAQTGTGPQSWHVDLAHRAEPARYIVVSCLREGQAQAPTELLDRKSFLSRREEGNALSEPFLVRSGRCSFYGTILDGTKQFVRFDPGCMQGATKRAEELMRRLLDKAPQPTYAHQWAAGDILLIDNWRLLHRRADASESLSRALIRVSVMEDV
jgi:hypothetical protein